MEILEMSAQEPFKTNNRCHLLDHQQIAQNLPVILDNNTGRHKKWYLIFRLNFGAVHFSVTKVLVLLDSRGMYKSFGTLSVCFYVLVN